MAFSFNPFRPFEVSHSGLLSGSSMCIEDSQFHKEDAYYWIFATIQYTTHSLW